MIGGVAGWVFARGGSKGVPGKNLREIGGMSLLARAIRIGLDAPSIEAMFVSTDDPAIAEAAVAAGAEVPFMRPAHLAADTAPEWLAWRHAVRYLHEERGWRPRAMVVLPATAPLRAIDDVEACVATLERTRADIVITVTPARHNPYFNMVTLSAAGDVGLVVEPPTILATRQEAPVVYDITTVAYAVDPAFVLRADSWREGSVKAVVVPPERAIDIDDELDLRVAASLLEQR